MRAPGAAESPGLRALSIAARFPAALLPVALLAAVGLSTRSLFTTGIATAAALTGLALSGPLAAAAAERFGRRPVLLAGAVAHVIALVLLVTAVDRFTQRETAASDLMLFLLVVGFAALAGLTVPPAAGVSRSRWHHLSRGPVAVPLRSGLRAEAAMEDVAVVLAPATAALLAWAAHPTAGLLAAAAVTAVAVPLYAMDSTIGLMDESPADEDSSAPQGLQEQEPPLRVVLPGAEQAHRRLREARRPEQGRNPRRVLPPVIVGSLLLGTVLALLWLTALSSALGVYRGAWFTFVVISLLTVCGTLSARGLPPRLADLPEERRRRLLSTLLAASLVGTLLAGALLSGWPGLLAVSVGAAAAGLCAGALLVELQLRLRALPVEQLGSAVTLSTGALLTGLVLGFAAGGAVLDALR